MASRVPWSQESRVRAARKRQVLARIGKIGVFGAFALCGVLLAIQL